ncbi:MAG TPA: Gfo/Idh/MocA family oxidoreductase [Longimicrobium sp.]|nr:Gfo/Idh/MocA family oxidoreductase [Longimicrobium sp.]
MGTGEAGGLVAEIRVAVIGYGLAGAAFHAPLIAATPGMRLAAVVTANAERAAQARSRYPHVEVVDSAERLWERAGEFDLVVVASPNRTHVPLARAALAAGLAVVVDKPFAPTASEARALIDEARRAGRLLTVYHNRRWDGDFLTLRRLLTEGALGEVSRFESHFERWRPEPKEGWRERGDPAEAGGVLFDLGPHLIDQALLLFGPARRVYAEVARRRPGVEVDDDAFVAITHESGVVSHLWASVAAAESGQRFRVLGSRAAYVKGGTDVQEAALRAGASPDAPGWGEESEDAWGRLGAGDAWTPVRTERGAYPAFYAAVAEALRTGGPPPVDPADAVAGLEIIEAARRSAAEGIVSDLPDAR